jgi:hypothetical protein
MSAKVIPTNVWIVQLLPWRSLEHLLPLTPA